jgi:hypothetical protein
MKATFPRPLLLLATLPLLAALAFAGPLAAQEAPAGTAAGEAAETASTSTGDDAGADPAASARRDSSAVAGDEAERDAYGVRNQLGSLVRRHADDLANLLALEPSLLANEAFLADYPDVASFVAAHPEVARNPRFYLAEFPVPGEGPDILEPFIIFAVFLVNVFVVFWLVRTVIEQRRWSRLARTQTEVHNKILERFGTSDALLEYMRTPAGSRFLESAPIPVHPDAAQASPVSRAIVAVQAGVVLAAGALGMLLVSGRFDADSARGLFALGVIALCVGLGFVASAIVSIVLSRRLGVWPAAAPGSQDLTPARFVE